MTIFHSMLLLSKLAVGQGFTSEQKVFLAFYLVIGIVALLLISKLLINFFLFPSKIKTVEELKLSDYQHINKLDLSLEESGLVSGMVGSSGTPGQSKWSGSGHQSAPFVEEEMDLTPYIQLLEEFNLTELAEDAGEAGQDSTAAQNSKAAPAPESEKLEIIQQAIVLHKYVLFSFAASARMVKPIEIKENKLYGFCYIKNTDIEFELDQIADVRLRDHYRLLHIEHPFEEPNPALIETAIQDKSILRIQYTRASKTVHHIDPDTWELISTVEAPEETTRTVSQVQFSIHALSPEDITTFGIDMGYITGYCHLREAVRTFKLNRINVLEILDTSLSIQ